MNLTTFIAFYGAFLSTIAIGWNIYNNLQDKPKIRVSAKFGFMGGDITLKKHFLLITAINKGKRSVHLNSFGLRTGKENMIPTRITGLPCELKSGKSHNEFFEVSELKDRQFDFAWYRDETGKLYKSKSIKKKLNNYFNSKKNKNTKMQKAFKGKIV